MKVLVIGGFLGSGKTTLVKQLASFIGARTEGPGIHAVILENEVGDTRVDETFLSASGLQVRNLSAGCACCTLAGETAITLAKIRQDLNPEWVIFEASGAAIPEKICQAVEALHLSVRSCVLADAARWRRIVIPLERLLEGQLMGANLVLVSKADMVSPEELAQVVADLQGRWGAADLLQASLLEPLPEDILEKILGNGAEEDSDLNKEGI